MSTDTPFRKRRKPIVVNVTVPEIVIEPPRVVVNLPEPKRIRRKIELVKDDSGEPTGAIITEG